MILVLDFDGVIIDSAYECLLTSYTAYRTGIDEPFPEQPHRPDRGFERGFLENRHLVRFAGEYWLLVRMLLDGGRIDKRSFAQAAKAHLPEITSFEPRFFAARERMVEADTQGWLNLHTVFPQFEKGWDAAREAAEDAYILSMKDGPSIKMLLDHFGISFAQDHILGREWGLDKAEALTALAERLGRRVSDFLFVDDHLPQLETVAETGAPCLWATWGYWPDLAGQSLPANINPCDSLEAAARRLT